MSFFSFVCGLGSCCLLCNHVCSLENLVQIDKSQFCLCSVARLELSELSDCSEVQGGGQEMSSVLMSFMLAPLSLHTLSAERGCPLHGVVHAPLKAFQQC